MNLILASDSFKGSLSSGEVNSILQKAAEDVFGMCECHKVMIADGGEGTLEAVMGDGNSGKYEIMEIPVTGPLGDIIKASYIKKGNRAVIEMAMASGLPLLDEDKRNPMNTTTKGTGELITHALQAGCTEIYVGIGGSATNDGGTGAMTALGFKFLDKEGNCLEGKGRNLIKISFIDDSCVIPELKKAKFTVMCDVVNPLTGSMGATYVYGPQKGANQDMLGALEAGMLNYQSVLQDYVNKKQFVNRRNAEQTLETVSGLGAAGGLGAALYVFTDSVMKSGIDVLLDLNGFDDMLDSAEMVVTGEGKTDYQSACGKVVHGIAKRCKEKNVPLFVISGSLSGDLDSLYEAGVTSMEASVCSIMDIDEAMTNADKYLYNAAVRIFRTIRSFR